MLPLLRATYACATYVPEFPYQSACKCVYVSIRNLVYSCYCEIMVTVRSQYPSLWQLPGVSMSSRQCRNVMASNSSRCMLALRTPVFFNSTRWQSVAAVAGSHEDNNRYAKHTPHEKIWDLDSTLKASKNNIYVLDTLRKKKKYRISNIFLLFFLL